LALVHRNQSFCWFPLSFFTARPVSTTKSTFSMTYTSTGF
jgi:hypothetical protein